MFRDRHHILHNRQEWSLRDEALKLRETPSIVPRISREDHNTIHSNCPAVPLLGFNALQRVLKIWEPDVDTLKSVDGLMSAIEQAGRHEKAHPIETELAQLAVNAIDLQRPFLRQALHSAEFLPF